MRPLPRPGWSGYAVAVVAVGAVALTLHLVGPTLTDLVRFVPFVSAVMVACCYGGLRVGIVATLLSTLVLDYFFLPPVGLGVANASLAVGLGIYVITCLVICAMCNALHETQRRLVAKQAEQRALREGEQARREELEAVIATVPAVVWIAHDTDCRRITGSLAGHAALRLPTDSNLSPPADGSGQFAVLQRGVPLPPEGLPMQRAARGEELRDVEFELAFDGGEHRVLLGNCAPLRNPDGSPRGAVGAFLDVTELKRAQKALVDADRRKDAFLAMLAHELRNPLAPLRNSLDLLALADGDPAVLAKCRTVMERQVQQMVRLVDDLLDLSRIAHDKLELRRERLVLGSVIRLAVETARPNGEADGAAPITLELPGEDLVVEGDRARLVQVFSNLLSNATKFTPQDGRITVTARREGSSARVAVSDTGFGIPPAMLDRIFDMFSQVERSGQSGGGLGIGLTLVRRLVSMHGGKVVAHSDGEGHGSEFVVTLPLAAPASKPRSPSPSPSPSRSSAAHPAQGRSLRVLVVDDHRDAAGSLATMVRMRGHDVCEAYDGAQAVDLVSRFEPDLVMLDLGLPRLNGYEVAARIRALPAGAGMILVAVTGWAGERERVHASGFDDFFVKPVSAGDIESILTRAASSSVS